MLRTLVCLLLIGTSTGWIGCTGSIGEPPTPFEDTPDKELEEVDVDKFFRGQALYDRNCAACHGVLEESKKRGASLFTIESALSEEKLMRAFASGLSPEHREDIAYALSQDPNRVECPPLTDTYRPLPKPRALLVEEFVGLGLERDVVSAALAEYQLGYEAAPDFDNQDSPTLIQSDSAETLLASMSNVAVLFIEQLDASECIDASCANSVLADLGARLDLSTDTTAFALEVFEEGLTLGLAQDALKLAVTRLLMSPDVTFRALSPSKTNEDIVAALAARSPSPGEAQLTPAELVERLLVSPEQLSSRFTLRWLGITQMIDSLEQGDITQLPVEFALLNDLKQETHRTFVNWVDEDLPISDLMLSEHTFINQSIAEYYGIEGISGETFQAVEVGTTRGGGFLAQGAVHVASGGSGETSPVTRGKWILENLLCLPLPPIPEDVQEQVEQQQMVDFDNPREASAARRSDARCEGCHHVMDEIGFGLEGFDAWGKTRTTYESGHPVDTAGQLPGDRHFADHRELAQHLSGSLAFRLCATKTFTRFVVGRELTQPEQCRVRKMATAFPQNISAKTWLKEVLESPVVTRVEEAQP